jgi:hypothetical protein
MLPVNRSETIRRASSKAQHGRGGHLISRPMRPPFPLPASAHRKCEGEELRHDGTTKLHKEDLVPYIVEHLTSSSSNETVVEEVPSGTEEVPPVPECAPLPYTRGRPSCF